MSRSVYIYRFPFLEHFSAVFEKDKILRRKENIPCKIFQSKSIFICILMRKNIGYSLLMYYLMLT